MQKEAVLGYLSLFVKPNLRNRTIYLSIAAVASNYVYYNLMINLGNMAGNTFLNYFALSVVEGPANFLAIWLSVSIKY